MAHRKRLAPVSFQSFRRESVQSLLGKRRRRGQEKMRKPYDIKESYEGEWLDLMKTEPLRKRAQGKLVQRNMRIRRIRLKEQLAFWEHAVATATPPFSQCQ